MAYDKDLFPASSQASTGAGSGYVTMGWLLLIAGIAATLYFMLGYDPTLPSTVDPTALGDPAGAAERINNTGLLTTKICGVVSSCSGAIIGAILIVAGQIQSATRKVDVQ